MSTDSAESHARWAERLRIPFLLLSDPERKAGRELGLMRRVEIGGWGIEFFRRATLLVDTRGVIAAVWGKVQVRGHAQQVLAAARTLIRLD